MGQVKEKSGQKTAQSTEALRDFLKCLPLFHDFSHNALSDVLTNARIKHYEKDDTLFMVGDKAEYFLIVIKGWIKLSRETRDGHEIIVDFRSGAPLQLDGMTLGISFKG